MNVIVKTKGGNLIYSLTEITDDYLSAIIRQLPIEDIVITDDKGIALSPIGLMDLSNIINAVLTYVQDKYENEYNKRKETNKYDN